MANLENLPIEQTAELLKIQKQELELKIKELNIQQQEITTQAKYAEQVLQAQINDRNNERQHIRKMQIIYMVVLVVLVMFVMLFLVYSLKLGYANNAFTIIKDIFKVAVGAISGYGYARFKNGNNNKN